MENISVVMPAYNEEAAVGSVVEDFLALEPVSEVVVADNNSDDRTAEIAREKGARVVEESRQGYGYAMKAALEAAEEDTVVSVESDQSYRARDMSKLLEYLEEFDAVLGDRTNTAMIEEGAKMGPLLRFGNKFLGRMIQTLFDGPRITDVGCSYRAFKREALDIILEADVRGPDLYSPQIIIETLERDMDLVLIPVAYTERKGKSKLTSSTLSSAVIGLQMATYIIMRRFIP